MKYPFIIVVFLCCSIIRSQTVNNGDFSSGTVAWGCNPETNPENVYGGGTANSVAEVDEQAGLCQTINGFVIGNVYSISLDYSRRTGGCPGPNPAGANITISDGALSASVASNVGSYALQTSSFTFTATQMALILTIAANFAGTTCGLIIDNVSIAPYSPLPIELVYFNASANYQNDVLEWQTASQSNNDFFTIERSSDAINWNALLMVKGEDNSYQTIHYTQAVNETLTGIYYYRLKQTDYNKRFSYSSISSVERISEKLFVFPNPASDQICLLADVAILPTISAINATGSQIELNYTISDSGILIDTSRLGNGIYTLKVSGPVKELYERIVISRN